jgi:biopolymer transport protein ExbD
MSIQRRFSDDSDDTGELNISPLIDMVFILLIFFIVTTVFVEETGVEINKPQASSAIDLEKNSILIAITDGGKVVYGGREIGTTGVRSVVRRLNQNERMPVIVQADKTVPTELLVRVIDEANLAGAPAVSVSTEN